MLWLSPDVRQYEQEKAKFAPCSPPTLASALSWERKGHGLLKSDEEWVWFEWPRGAGAAPRLAPDRSFDGFC